MNKETINELSEIAATCQWFHTAFAVLNTNRPHLSAKYYEKANQAQKILWEMYCEAGDEQRRLIDHISANIK